LSERPESGRKAKQAARLSKGVGETEDKQSLEAPGAITVQVLEAVLCALRKEAFSTSSSQFFDNWKRKQCVEFLHAF
jgi:hypothetical protein